MLLPSGGALGPGAAGANVCTRGCGRVVLPMNPGGSRRGSACTFTSVLPRRPWEGKLAGARCPLRLLTVRFCGRCARVSPRACVRILRRVCSVTRLVNWILLLSQEFFLEKIANRRQSSCLVQLQQIFFLFQKGW